VPSGKAGLGPPLIEAEVAQGFEAFQFFSEEVFHVHIQKAAEGGQVKKVVSDAFLDDFPAMLAQVSRQVGIHKVPAFLPGGFGRVGLSGGVDGEAAAKGDGFANGTVHFGGGFLEFGKGVDDAFMPDEKIGHLLLKLAGRYVLHGFTPHDGLAASHPYYTFLPWALSTTASGGDFRRRPGKGRPLKNPPGNPKKLQKFFAKYR